MDTNPERIKEEPLVSILMLTYNRAKYIRTAIDSVLSQAYQNFELVIIDDGSTDATGTILSSYTDPRIRVLAHSENKGVHARREESLKHAQGTYTAVLDSDDVWIDAIKLTSQVAYMEKNKSCSIVGTFITLIDTQGANIGKNSYKTTDTSIRNNMLMRNQFAHSSVLMRTSMLTEVPGYRDTGLAEDLDLFLQLGTKGTFTNLPKYMAAYRVHTESFNPQRIAMAKAVLIIIKKYKHNYPRYYHALIKAYIRIFLNTVLH